MRQSVPTAREEGGSFPEQPEAPVPSPAVVASTTQPAEPILEIPCPRVIEVHRTGAEPSPGDSASVVLPAGLLRLLMHPVAGGAEPLGRGFHPPGVFPIAIACCAAAAACGEPEPFAPREWQVEHVKIRWRKPFGEDCSAVGKATLMEVKQDIVRADLEILDQASGDLLMSGTARLRRIPGEASQ
jgi:hypothetical protein